MVPHGAGTDRPTSFHAHHAPVGALATFTLGRHHHDSGPGNELGRAAPGAVYAGYRDGEGKSAILNLLPFFPVSTSDLERYVGSSAAQAGHVPRRLFSEADIVREVGWTTDRWRAGDVVLEVLTPVEQLPDPRLAPLADQRDAFVPAVTLRLSVANPGTQPRELFFALGNHQGWAAIPGLHGLASRTGYGFAVDSTDARRFLAFDPEWEFNRTHDHALFGLGSLAGLRLGVPPGGSRTLTIVVGWWKEGPVTYGKRMAYWYTRLFSGLADVLAHALARAPKVAALCAARDAELTATALNPEQRFLVAHSTRGYYASTQLLDDGGRPRWVVNEGEYLMLNTFDLTVDMAFFEARFQPWALKNVLEQFASEYRYESRLFDPADPTRLLPGGVAFCHDMGVQNTWSPDGSSAYEVEGLDRACFSFMSCEELTNWVLCAGIYWTRTRDTAFLAHHAGLLVECQRSLLNRDHPDSTQRRGWMQCEDERCRGGGEITTYDSLDHSLGQSRGNGYLAGKMWASHVVLADLLGYAGRPDAVAASREAALRSAAAIAASADPTSGIMPSLLDKPSTAPIIPAIEALAYPAYMGLKDAVSATGPFGGMITALQRHLRAVLVEGVCLYPDGGWKLSASADNSWASKIHLCQWVARNVLNVHQGADGIRADRAHADWQRVGSANHAVSDQFRSGVAIGSLYYPRIVTTILWLDGGRCP
jgi:hypothetical protein